VGSGAAAEGWGSEVIDGDVVVKGWGSEVIDGDAELIGYKEASCGDMIDDSGAFNKELAKMGSRKSEEDSDYNFTFSKNKKKSCKNEKGKVVVAKGKK
jgi:hypothetical protein